MTFSPHLDPIPRIEDSNDGTGPRQIWLDKKGEMAIVGNWRGTGKWKILLPSTLSSPQYRKHMKKMGKSYDSLEDAIQVYDTVMLPESAA